MKIDQCNHCQFYSHQLYFVCALNPSGVEGDSCLDFRPEPNAEEEELWAPEETYYDGELIPNTPSRYTPEEQLEILNTHPLFTGVCPNCGQKFDRGNLPIIHWDCPNPECGWMDDSV